jgi:hypothetical protein
MSNLRHFNAELPEGFTLTHSEGQFRFSRPDSFRGHLQSVAVARFSHLSPRQWRAILREALAEIARVSPAPKGSFKFTPRREPS